MPPEGKSTTPIEVPKSELDVARRHMEFRASDGFLEKQKQIHHEALAREATEKKSRRMEGADLLALSVKLVTLDTNTDKAKADSDETDLELNEDEKKIYQETVEKSVEEQGKSPEDKEALRVTMTEVIFKPSVFKVHYEEWSKEYAAKAGDSVFMKKFPDLVSYVLDRGKAFITERRNEIVASRLKKYRLGSAEAKPDATQEVDLKKITEATVTFLDAHQKELLEYSGLDDKGRDALYNQFLKATGLKVADAQIARQLFDDIVGDFEMAFTAEKKLDARNARMIELMQQAIDAGMDVNEKDWDKMLEDCVKKDAFFEKVSQPQSPQYYQPAGSTETFAAGAPLENVQQVAMAAGGLQIVGEQNPDGSYNVKYPNTGYGEFMTTMRIEPKPGSKTLDDATIVIVDPYADQTGSEADKKKPTELRMDKQSLRASSNFIYLDYVLNAGLKVESGTSPSFDVNNLLKDEALKRISTNFFGRNLGEIQFTPALLQGFGRFIGVLMKGDGTDTTYGNLAPFVNRVRIIDEALAKKGDRDYALDIRNMFLPPGNSNKPGSANEGEAGQGASTFTVSTLLESLDYKRAQRFA